MRVQEFINISVWASNEEVKLLEKLRKPVRLSSLAEHDQFKIQALIRRNRLDALDRNL